MSSENDLPDTTDIDPSNVQEADEEELEGPLGLYNLQRHRNGDVTAVLLLEFGGGYQALALDVDGGGQLLEVEEIGDSPERDKAVGMVEYWLDQNPEGILGPGEEDDGFLQRLFGGWSS